MNDFMMLFSIGRFIKTFFFIMKITWHNLKIGLLKGFKGKPLIFFLKVSVKLGPKKAVSRVFWSKNLKPVVVSLKPGVFGGVGGLTPGWARGPERRPEWSAVNPWFQ